MERERVTVQEAARRLGISESAVRKRVQRQQIEYEREEDGRLFVYLDRGETGRDEVRDAVQDRYITSLEEQIAYLREQFAAERETNRENRRLLAAALERIPPQLEAPPEERESAEGPSEASGSGGVPREAESGVSRPWWRRWFR